MTVSGTSDGILQVSATTCANSSTTLGLQGPVKSSHLGIRETARTTTLMLDVIRSTVAAIASGVIMLTTETETGGTLRHLTKGTMIRRSLRLDRLICGLADFFHLLNIFSKRTR